MDKSRGKGGRKCRVQGSKPGRGGLIRKYAINMNRQVFRERAVLMGWKKYR
jgi:small subunit ribosomal protein S29e